MEDDLNKPVATTTTKKNTVLITALAVLVIVAIIAISGAIYYLLTREEETCCGETPTVNNDNDSTATNPPTDSEVNDTPPSDAAGQTPTSVVDRLVVGTPGPLAIHNSGDKVTLTGQMRDFFEGTMNVRLVAANGTILLDTPVMASGDNYGQFSDYEKEVTIPAIPAGVGEGKWVYYEVSAKDGSEDVLLNIDVVLRS